MALTAQDATTVSARTLIVTLSGIIAAHGWANNSNAELIASVVVIAGMWAWGLIQRHLSDRQKKELEIAVDVARQMPPSTLSELKGVLERTGTQAVNVDMLKGVSADTGTPVPPSVAQSLVNPQ